MKEFDYSLDYKNLDFTDLETRKLYRIGRGEQGVLMVEPYKSQICPHWKFKDENIARKSANKIYEMYCDYKRQKDFVGMDLCRKYLEMGHTRSRRYANHKNGKKYDKTGAVLPQEKDALVSVKATSATIFKEVRDKVAYDPVYQQMRKQWRAAE